VAIDYDICGAEHDGIDNRHLTRLKGLPDRKFEGEVFTYVFKESEGGPTEAGGVATNPSSTPKIVIAIDHHGRILQSKGSSELALKGPTT